MPASEEVQTEVAERRAKAVQLRIAGASLDEIGQALGYGGSTVESRRAAVCKDLKRAFEAAKDEEQATVTEWRELELTRLDRLQRGLWSAAIGGDVQAARAVLQLMERRARYIPGLEAPVKTEVSGSELKVTVVGVDVQQAMT